MDANNKSLPAATVEQEPLGREAVLAVTCVLVASVAVYAVLLHYVLVRKRSKTVSLGTTKTILPPVIAGSPAKSVLEESTGLRSVEDAGKADCSSGLCTCCPGLANGLTLRPLPASTTKAAAARKSLLTLAASSSKGTKAPRRSRQPPGISGFVIEEEAVFPSPNTRMRLALTDNVVFHGRKMLRYKASRPLDTLHVKVPNLEPEALQLPSRVSFSKAFVSVTVRAGCVLLSVDAPELDADHLEPCLALAGLVGQSLGELIVTFNGRKEGPSPTHLLPEADTPPCMLPTHHVLTAPADDGQALTCTCTVAGLHAASSTDHVWVVRSQGCCLPVSLSACEGDTVTLHVHGTHSFLGAAAAHGATLLTLELWDENSNSLLSNSRVLLMGTAGTETAGALNATLAQLSAYLGFAGLEDLIISVGVFAEYVTSQAYGRAPVVPQTAVAANSVCLQHFASAWAQEDAYAEAALGHGLDCLAFLVAAGTVPAATYVASLFITLGYSLQDVAAGVAQRCPLGRSLLHMAVESGERSMVAAVLNWAMHTAADPDPPSSVTEQTGAATQVPPQALPLLRWDVPDSEGVTPCHLLATQPGLASWALVQFPEQMAGEGGVWWMCRAGSAALSPADVAARLGAPVTLPTPASQQPQNAAGRPSSSAAGAAAASTEIEAAEGGDDVGDDDHSGAWEPPAPSLRTCVVAATRGFADARVEAQYQAWLSQRSMRVATGWVSLMLFFMLTAMTRMVKERAGIRDLAMHLLYVQPYIYLAVILATAQSFFVKHREKLWTLVMLTRYASKIPPILGLVHVPAAVVVYIKRGVTNMTDALIPGACEIVSPRRKMALALLDMAVAAAFYVHIGHVPVLLHAAKKTAMGVAMHMAVDCAWRRAFLRAQAGKVAKPKTD